MLQIDHLYLNYKRINLRLREIEGLALVIQYNTLGFYALQKFECPFCLSFQICGLVQMNMFTINTEYLLAFA